MQKILPISKNVLFIIVLVISVTLIALAWIPTLLGGSVAGVQDASMAPEVPKGAYVFAKKVSFSEIQEGDLLLFADPNSRSLFVRKVAEVWTDKQQIVTCDSEGSLDAYTTAYSCVQGKVTKQVPGLGYASVWMHTVVGKAIIIILYIIWISLEIEFYRVHKKEKSHHE